MQIYLHPSVLRIEHLASAFHELSVKVCLGWPRFFAALCTVTHAVEDSAAVAKCLQAVTWLVALRKLSANAPYLETILSNKGRPSIRIHAS